MYRRHKILLLVCFGGIFLIAFFFNWEFYAVAEAAITVASIAMGVYIAAVSALLGSQYAKDLKGKTDKEYPIPPLFCACWMRKQECSQSAPARATNRRASSSPSRRVSKRALLRFPTRICLTRSALSLARIGFPASVTRCAVSGLPMQKPCALTLTRAFRRTFALLRRAMTQNNP